MKKERSIYIFTDSRVDRQILMIFLVGLLAVPLTGQTDQWLPVRQQLSELQAQYKGETGRQTVPLDNIHRQTVEMLDRRFPLGEEAGLLQSEVLLLKSLVEQRQGNLLAAFRTIEQSMQSIAKVVPNYGLRCLSQMDHYAFLLAVYKEEYLRPIQLQKSIRKLLQELPLTQRMANYEAVTINNLIRLADLYERTEQPGKAASLVREAENLLTTQPVTEESRFRFQLFQIHSHIYHSDLWRAEREAREILARLQQQTGQQYRLAAVQSLYGKVLYGMGRLQEAENYYRSALSNYESCCDYTGYEEKEIRQDLAACYEAQSAYVTGRALLEKQLAALQKEDADYGLRLADLYGSLADNYFSGRTDDQPELISQAVEYDRKARRQYYNHRHLLTNVRDARWAAVGEQYRRDRSIAILWAAYHQTGEDRYFFETLEVLEQNKNILLRAQLTKAEEASLPWSEVKIDPSLLLKKLSDQQQTLIAMASTRDRLYLLVLSPRGKLFLSLRAAGESLAHKVMYLRKSIQLSPSQPTEEQLEALLGYSRELYDLLLQPLEEIATERLLVMSEGPLETLPLSMLLREDASLDEPFTEWPFAIREYSFSYTYSLDFYLHPRRSSVPFLQPEILAFAPNFEAGYLRGDTTRSAGELHSNAEEVNYLTGQFPCNAYVGEEASLENFLRLAPDYAILHLATHAVANTEKGGESYLTFAETHDQSNRLHAHELDQLNIPAELVVLSACETGLGEWQRGEGVVGLERAFWAVGAKSLVTTCWKVSDRASSQLMQLFYDQLAKGLPKDVALQRAQLQFLAQHDTWLAYPFFWAGYVQKGSTESIGFAVKTKSWPWWALGGLLLIGVIYSLAIRNL